MSRLLSDLDARARPLGEMFIGELKRSGLLFSILETRRDVLVQAAYFAQGREPYARIIERRKAAGLGPIGEAEAGRIITRTLKSKHIDGLALDVVPLTEHGTIPWKITEETAKLWRAIGEIGEAAGLEWGGRWAPLNEFTLGWDLPHYEYKG